MANPLAVWDDNHSAHPNLVWWSRLDHRFQIEVQRVDNYAAKLIIFDHLNENAELLCEDVGLSYGALFGPDVSDVDEWQNRCMKFIDEEFPLRELSKT